MVKRITCEMCGGNDILKQDSLFVCQSCETKYTVEEAKKLMIEGTVEVAGTVKIDTSADVEALMMRGHLFLDDADWTQANEYFDRVLDIDPKHAPAYIGKLCAELKVSSESDLPSATKTVTADSKQPEYMLEVASLIKSGAKISAIKVYKDATGVGLKEAKDFVDSFSDVSLKVATKTKSEYVDLSNNNNFSKARRFASADYLAKLEGYISEQIRLAKEQARLEHEREEERRKQVLEAKEPGLSERYDRINDSKRRMHPSEHGWRTLASLYRGMNGYRDTAELADECEAQILIVREEQRKREEQSAQWQQQGLCSHCGGQLGGLLTQKCKTCGKAP